MLERALTERVGWTIGVAILVLVVIGRVGPVRARVSRIRRMERDGGGARSSGHRLVVEYEPVALYRRPRWWHRAFALGATGVVSVVVGAIVALVVGATAVWAVTWLTSQLR
jgi:hypothetical protein